ncbi:ASCH domain-containing protein [Spiroplasma tabanidicola]|uniref:RNA-binding protein n=1 Tax=Spiroplasma tabanidicola TaxID=324079 RepID=A0A6I6CDL4_9MOLU|nr:ASCH domain-containing protein [Spiroplasma tabanidicola]QGS52398.1 RNA-binding protein [Spiroplasma tabanidicola]
MSIKVNDYWNKYLEKNKLSKSLKFTEAFYFGNTKEMADELGDLVARGIKTATTSCDVLYDLEKENKPKVGDISIVTDFKNNPICIIKNLKVTYLYFKDMTFDLCEKEGEDIDLNSWRKKHTAFFSDAFRKKTNNI